MGGESSSSPTSSTDSSIDPCKSSTWAPRAKSDLSTDLRLGLSLSTSSLHTTSSNVSKSQTLSNWPPIKSLLRSTIEEKRTQGNRETFYVKVHMEGIPVGRKVDLFAHNDYDSLITTLCLMFRTTIILAPEHGSVSSRKVHLLTYEDKDGDWMMVGDVDWEFFLRSVKRLMIRWADRC